MDFVSSCGLIDFSLLVSSPGGIVLFMYLVFGYILFQLNVFFETPCNRVVIT